MKKTYAGGCQCGKVRYEAVELADSGSLVRAYAAGASCAGRVVTLTH